MDELIAWYEDILGKLALLDECEQGACYRVGDGVYVSERDFEGLFCSTVERTIWMCLRNAELMGEFDLELSRLSRHVSDIAWLDVELVRLLESDDAGCYFTGL